MLDNIMHISNMKVADRLMLSQQYHNHGGFDFGVLRPYRETNGESYVTLNGQAYRVDNAALRKDEWIMLDEAVMQAAVLRQRAVQDLLNRGLSLSLDGMSFTVLETENVGELTAASLSLTGYSQSEKDTVEHGLTGVPMPIVFKDWDISLRGLQTGRNRGQPLETSQGEAMARVVGEKIEDMFFNGATSFEVGGYTIYGLTNFPNRNTGSLTASWTTATGEQIVGDVQDMIQDAIDDRYYGPFILYVPSAYSQALGNDFKANSDKTVRQRIMELDEIEAVMVVDHLATANVLLAQLTSDVMRIIDGMAPTSVMWESEGGFKINMKSLAIRVPQIRSDNADRCGVVHYTV
jgi:hypothetical protein